MFSFEVNKNNIELTEAETITSGSVNVYFCHFTFSPDWDGLAKTITFRAGDVSISVILDSTNICAIPWEVLQVDAVQLYAGVRGTVTDTDTEEEAVIPTVYALLGTIRKGTELGDNAQPPEPSIVEQIMSRIETLDEEKQDKLSGQFGQVVSFDEFGNVIARDEKGTEYKAGENIEISADNTISAKMYDDTEIRGEINSVKTATAENAEAIATNSEGIAANTADIAKNTADISTNAAGIAANSEAIAKNKTDINKNSADIAKNVEAIAKNKTDIAKNKADIAKNTADIAKNTADISANAASIAKNAGDVKTVSDKVDTLNTSISTLSKSVTDNTDAIKTTRDDIAALSSSVSTATEEIAKNTAGLSAASEEISTLKNSKQDKLHGTEGQVVGFDKDGNPMAQEGGSGTPGKDGTTFIPMVSPEGMLSWTNDGGKENPEAVNIRGPQGPAGTYTAGDNIEISEDGVISAKTYDDTALKSDITKNTAAINSMKSDISANTSAIEAANANISEVSSSLQSAKSDISANTSAIASANENISANTSAIEAANSNISDISSSLQSAKSDISANTSAIASANENISANTSAIEAANANISEVSSSLQSAKSDISANTSAIAATNANVSDISSSLQSAKSDISANTSAIEAANANISEVSSSLQSAKSDISANTSAIASANANISGLESSKQDKLSGQPGQFVGFDAEGNAIAQEGGVDGVTFTPVVSSAGIISWSNDGGRENPTPVNIKGTPGSPGANGVTFTPTVSSEGVISWSNDGGLSNPAAVNIKGPAGTYRAGNNIIISNDVIYSNTGVSRKAVSIKGVGPTVYANSFTISSSTVDLYQYSITGTDKSSGSYFGNEYDEYIKFQGHATIVCTVNTTSIGKLYLSSSGTVYDGKVGYACGFAKISYTPLGQSYVSSVLRQVATYRYNGFYSGFVVESSSDLSIDNKNTLTIELFIG